MIDTTDTATANIAATLNYAPDQPLVGVTAEQITLSRTGRDVTGYTVTGLATRHIAHRVAIAAVSSFDALPDERQVSVRVVAPQVTDIWAVRVRWTD